MTNVDDINPDQTGDPVRKASFITPIGQVVRTDIWNESIFFTITNARDAIQKHHARGQFYELEELDIIRRFCPLGSVYCDIGTNIGNHTLFALKYLRVSQAILFEPNPAAIEVLISNLTLNGVIDRCDLSYLGMGLSDHPAEGLGMAVPRRNLGGGKMVEGTGELRVIPGDEALAGKQIDFIKMDIEGMELKALAGLEQTIARCRPRLFVEVDRENDGAFREWVRAHNYQIKDHFKRYRTNRNYLLVPGPEA